MARNQYLSTNGLHLHYPAEFFALKNAIHRCHNEEHASYYNYGARGIHVTDAWRMPGGFDDFMACVGPRPSALHSLDRINNDGGYAPDNVRWAVRKVQQNNCRPRSSATNYGFGFGQPTMGGKGKTSPLLVHNGVKLTITDWSKIKGLAATTIHQRLKRGMSIADALNPQLRVNFKTVRRSGIYLNADGTPKL